MKLLGLVALLFLVSCQDRQKPDENIIQSDDYVLVEFAAKLEEAEHAAPTDP